MTLISRKQSHSQTTIIMFANRVLRFASKRGFPAPFARFPSRNFSFSFAGPKNLNDILKKDLVQDKSRTEVADIWYTYHEGKENVHGLVLRGEEAESLLSRAASRYVS